MEKSLEKGKRPGKMTKRRDPKEKEVCAEKYEKRIEDKQSRSSNPIQSHLELFSCIRQEDTRLGQRLPGYYSC